MEVLDTPDTALVILSFLQADFNSAEFRDEVLSLGRELTRELDLKGSADASPDDGYLETDGSRTSSITFRLHGVQAAEGPQRLDAAAAQQVARELRDLADQFERSVVAEAAENLRKSLLTSATDKWEGHLFREVSRVIRHSVTLRDVAQEHITVALTLTLVKGVCEQTPRLLRSLFTATLHYIIHSRAR